SRGGIETVARDDANRPAGRRRGGWGGLASPTTRADRKERPVNRLAVVPATAAVVAATVVGLGRAGGATYQTLDLVGVPTAQRVMLDVAPKGDSPGDQGFKVGDVYEHGRRVGRYQGTCTVLPRSNSQCTFTVGLKGGQIVLVAGYGPGLNGDAVVHEPVVGGSGVYEGV